MVRQGKNTPDLARAVVRISFITAMQAAALVALADGRAHDCATMAEEMGTTPRALGRSLGALVKCGDPLIAKTLLPKKVFYQATSTGLRVLSEAHENMAKT